MKDDDKKRILVHVPFLLILSTNGGPDHKNTNIATKSALLGMVLILNLESVVAFRNTLNCSWINLVERVTSLLNLGLQHCGYARKSCPEEIEQKIKSLNTMKALRDEAEMDNTIREEWRVSGCIDKIGRRFSRLEQKGEKVQVQKVKANKQDVLTLKNVVVNKAGYDISCTRKIEYLKPHMQQFRERLEQGSSQQELYITEIRGKLTRVPVQVQNFLNIPFRRPEK